MTRFRGRRTHSETRITRAERKTQFPFLRTIDEFNFTYQTALTLQMLGSYLGPELVSEGRSAILSGPSATGKSHLCIAIAYRAIQHGYEARFVGADALIGALSRAAVKGRLEAALEPCGWIQPEWVAGFNRNRWPDSAGIRTVLNATEFREELR